MMKIATIAALVGSAAAFAPVPVSKVRLKYSGIAADFFWGGGDRRLRPWIYLADRLMIWMHIRARYSVLGSSIIAGSVTVWLER